MDTNSITPDEDQIDIARYRREARLTCALSTLVFSTLFCTAAYMMMKSNDNGVLQPGIHQSKDVAADPVIQDPNKTKASVVPKHIYK